MTKVAIVSSSNNEHTAAGSCWQLCSPAHGILHCMAWQALQADAYGAAVVLSLHQKCI
jgi:hypothetical protein